MPLVGIDLALVLSVQHKRSVDAAHSVSFNRVHLQLPNKGQGGHLARCPVIVHQCIDGTLAVSYQGSLGARFTVDGVLMKGSLKLNAA